MNRFIAISATSIFCILSGVAAAQQEQSGQSEKSDAPSSSGQSGASSSGASGATSAPVAGKTRLGITVVQTEAVIRGWSAKRDLLDKTVMNDKKEEIGDIEDLIITPSTDAKLPFASFAIIGVGGFLGIGENDVAIPMEQLKLQDKQLVLPGATKDELKKLPPFEYARK